LLDAVRLRDTREAERIMVEHLQRLELQLKFTPPAVDLPDLVSLFGVSEPSVATDAPMATAAR
jgi:hypothetical protein